MTLFDIEDVVMKLVGPVLPVGESNEDIDRLVNLNELTGLVDRLLYTIEQASHSSNRQEASMKKIGERAKEYLSEVRNAR